MAEKKPRYIIESLDIKLHSRFPYRVWVDKKFYGCYPQFPEGVAIFLMEEFRRGHIDRFAVYWFDGRYEELAKLWKLIEVSNA